MKILVETNSLKRIVSMLTLTSAYPDKINADHVVGIFCFCMFYVYIIYSPGFHRFYIGQTSNLTNRIKRHNDGLENYTAKYKPWTLVWSTTKNSRGEAMILERKLKNLNRKRLEDFIAKYSYENPGRDEFA